MTFDWTISLGHIATLIAFIFGGGGFVALMRIEVRELKADVRDVKAKLDKVNEILVVTARQDERLNSMERRVDDLQHGRGFVLDALPHALKAGR